MITSRPHLLGEAHWLKPPTLARRHGNHLHELFYDRSPGKEHRTIKSPPTARVWERSKGDTTCPTTSQNPPCIHLGWTRHASPGRTLESEWLAKDNLETNPNTIKPETASHVVEQFSWVPLTYCSLPGHIFPIKSLALSALVSPLTIHFCVLDKSLISVPRRGLPSCNTLICLLLEWPLLPAASAFHPSSFISLGSFPRNFFLSCFLSPLLSPSVFL